MELLGDKMRVWVSSAAFVKPNSAVYVFYNRKKEVIYIGNSTNLEKTFSKYVETDFEGKNANKKLNFIKENLWKILKNVNYN